MWAELYTQDSQHDILRKCGVANVIFLPLKDCKRGGHGSSRLKYLTLAIIQLLLELLKCVLTMKICSSYVIQ